MDPCFLWQYDPADNGGASCNFHPGAPLFHEGLKSYTCCNTGANKPVLSFDDFLAIPGCATGSHSSEKSEIKQPVVTANVSGNKDTTTKPEGNLASIDSAMASASLKPLVNGGPTVYKSRPVSPHGQNNDNNTDASTNGGSVASTSALPNNRPAPPAGVQNAAVHVEDEDPEDAAIAPGTKCKRQGCGQSYSEERNKARSSDECTYHPLPAIFHEGSKGYACCKRRVLEFDEFLKIEGCKKGRHLFAGQPKNRNGSGKANSSSVEGEEEEKVDCRSDMYQTPTQVICSVFGKGADREASSVKFDEWEMHVDLKLPGNKRFTRSYELYGPVEAPQCSFRIMGTKVEIVLAKGDGRSWPMLEAPKDGHAGLAKQQITFGVSGRTGSVGAKEMVYRGDVVH